MLAATALSKFWSEVAAGDPLSLLATGCFAAMYFLITGALEAQLWKRCAPLGKKLYWSLILTVPLLGWLFYMAFYQVPPSQHFR